MCSRSRLSPSTSWRLKAPRVRSLASISQSPLRDTRSALTVSTLRSTSRSTLSWLTPGRSNSITKRSPSRQASIGITTGRLVVPSSCWVRRSKSRNGSVVRSNMMPPDPGWVLGASPQDLYCWIQVLYSPTIRSAQVSGAELHDGQQRGRLRDLGGGRHDFHGGAEPARLRTSRVDRAGAYA